MAQTATKKKTNNSGKKQSSAQPKNPKNEPVENKSAQRIIAAVCFLFAAVLVVIGIFAHDGVVVGWLCSLLKGLFGYGFWICAPVFLLAAYILGFHRDEPCTWRLTAALLLPLLAAQEIDARVLRHPVQPRGKCCVELILLQRPPQLQKYLL